MAEKFNLWLLLAGVGIFVFGIFLLEESIKNLSGRAFKKFINKYTSTKIKSIITGAFVTSVLQSSSAVSLMVLAFVGAGIMTIQNAVGVIIGSNLGTTITAWIVATVGFKIDVESFYLPLLGLGGLGIILLGHSEKYSNISKLFVAFGFIFIGLDYMKSSVEVFTKDFDFNTLANFGMVTYVGAGVLLTAILQSSSATLAIVLTALNSKIIGFDAAALLVIGANIGTTITILIGSLGGTQTKKRVAISHLIFNVITAVIAVILLPLLVQFVLKIFKSEYNTVFALAAFHTLFNLIGVILFYPFINSFSNFLIKIIPDKKTEVTLYISNAIIEVEAAAITVLKKEILHLIINAIRHNLKILKINENEIFNNKNQIQIIKENDKYENLKLLQAKIFIFATKIQTHSLTAEESKTLNRYLHSARMALYSSKTMKDIKHDLDYFENSENLFLNNQYLQLKGRMIKTYNKIYDLIFIEKEILLMRMLQIFKELTEDDHEFINLIKIASENKQLNGVELSTLIIVNRSIVQSTEQLLYALEEILLDEEQIISFNKLNL